MKWLIVLLGLGAGLIGGLILVVVEFGAWALVTPRRVASPTPDANEDETATDIWATSTESIRARAADGVELAGRWIAAPGSPTGRTMILVHGFVDGPEAMVVDRGRAILDHGWNIAAVDLRGYGESQGAFSSFGGREAGDLRAWLDVLAARCAPGEPFAPVIWGRSMGAAIALRAAVEDDRVRALVLEAPMVDLEAAVTTLTRNRKVPMAPLLSRLIVSRAGRLAKVSLHRPRPLDLAARCAQPVVVVHGANDPLIPSSKARILADAFPTPAAFIEVPAARHADVVRVGGPDLLAEILAFVDRHVEASRTA
ncbi:alpha/beta hydrolase [Paludisphaera borealis]|uniref:2-succinyl-6-hydroxy-2, 4-cyclohexadiene-1-carboxylate synthase n=1 Tax=Paludisphaera borealis TaxID=1387353 RepID=A0A1U7CT98_9BACT|nr:alpha/beta fold hydrolase [Paludisphaera borealis]APW62167.1 2-succinyl-6-hydroxy-2,4-cyclohexadiene-1-carboxylate synthase [Paludisphaera borealis]